VILFDYLKEKHTHTHALKTHTHTHAHTTQVPALNIFETSYRKGKFDESRKLSNGKLMEFTHIFPMDAVFDTLEDVPEDVSACK
jgi:hypothetical protein